MFPYSIHCTCFNTQPPEGGWVNADIVFKMAFQFQHTAARRRLALLQAVRLGRTYVSTHSRPKAAGRNTSTISVVIVVSTHSRPKAAGFALCIEQDTA